ncbi:MAG: UDP-N-acetylmuramoyl-L-alanine--D-glutamate ligase [Firmicutes bacterium]|nr:UDP-N-acetylmuramoyl-L-alanine--D-glutamate ligase [Alicyclobacillaceae bacterium]MCL6496470.1 UDP-N-acetylmuramoyl-L-alanine--D-glutamate ligase [Bacillota bacterium]
MAGETVAVVGLGANNQPLVPYLSRRGYRLVVADRKPPDAVQATLATLEGHEAVEAVYAGPDYLERLSERTDLAAVYLTPGMVKTQPPILKLKAGGTRITCETDLVLASCPLPVVGITGSAGKSTTTTLVGLALKASGVPTWMGGNLGRSLLWDWEAMAASGHGVAVLELSSFQLELVEHSPWGAVFLNLTPNHLDVHESFEAYGMAKSRILAYQGRRDWAVLPARDPVVEQYAGVGQGRRYRVDLEGPVEAGMWSDGEWLWWQPAGQAAQPVVAVSAIRLIGRHNLANVAYAAAAALLAGGRREAVAQVAREFGGLPHRLETVATVKGVTFINDSIATTPERTAAALGAVTAPAILIAGGYDKHLDYTPLAEAVAKSTVRAVVLIGATREKIATVLDPLGVQVFRAESLEGAAALAAAEARAGEVVLLSPASASYDMFRDFQERGERFRRWVQDYKARVGEGRGADGLGGTP